jgi:flagellar protein FliS
MAYSNTNFSKYLEAEVFGADPVKLVCMLYRAAIDAAAAARRHLRAGEIRERSRQIMRVSAILRELTQSLDPHYPEISRPLGDLYAYMQKQLLAANAKQIEAPLADVEQLLSTLLEGWKDAVPPAPPIVAEVYQPVSCSY